MSKEGHKRMNIILPDRTTDRIERLRLLTLSPSDTDVIKMSILVYAHLLEYYTEGYELYIKKGTEDHYTPVKILLDLPEK
jgi:hypothetical protein